MNKNQIYTYSGKEISMTLSDNEAVWVQFFNRLVEFDAMAPLHVLLNYFDFLFDLKEELPATPYSGLYYDVAIELAAADRFPAFEAAVSCGFFNSGLAMLARATSLEVGNKSYARVLVCACEHGYIKDFASEDVKAMVDEMARTCPDERRDEVWWVMYLKRLMTEDPCTPTSVLAYFLDEVNEHAFHIFCPLGFAEYESVGAQMRCNPNAFEAALESGLLADAIPTYMGAALDCIENWHIAVRGINYLLNHPVLSRLIPFRDRFVAEKLIAEFGLTVPAEEEEQWGERCADLFRQLSEGKWRGY